MTKLHLIGIGYKPLDKKARQIILNSEVILASQRLFEVFKGYNEFDSVKDKVKVINNVDETIDFIRTQAIPLYPTLNEEGQGKVVLLASGDPMFFGIGRRAIAEFGKDAVEIIPDLSSMQIAFSKIREPWDDAFLISLHGGPDPEKRRRLPYEIKDLPWLIEKYSKIAILTDRENNPSKIADFLSSAFSLKPKALRIYVCAKLGYSDERVIEGTLEEISTMTFSEPNIVIILKTGHMAESIPHTQFTSSKERRKGCGGLSFSDVKFGLKETEFVHSRGLITKDEVRAVTIHKLRLPQTGVFWDIGAGSGSVSVEAARLCPSLRIYAVEKDAEQTRNIQINKESFNTINIEIINGEAPHALNSLPTPDRVFIGGSGARIDEIISFAGRLMQAGIIAVNAATIETLNEAIKSLSDNGFDVEVSEISVSRSKIIAGRMHMSALNPVFIITGEKGIR